MADINRIACIQMNANSDVKDNVERASNLIRAAAADGAIFVLTPEYFSGFHVEGSKAHPAAFRFDQHPVINTFSALACELSITLLLGSVGVCHDDGKISNRSVVLDKTGRIITCYDKIHLFDVDLGGGNTIRESATIAPGESAVIAQLSELSIGLSICYDVRFPHLYRALSKAGAQVLAVPAAFTRKTGEAHWHVLLRSRAIENGCFVVAPGQCGKVEGGGENFGHSLIIDPWGRILAEAGVDETYIIADIDLDKVEKCRRRIPSLEHEREFSLADSTD